MEAIIIVVVVLEKMRDEWIDFLKWYSNVSMSNRYYHSPPHVTRKKIITLPFLLPSHLEGRCKTVWNPTSIKILLSLVLVDNDKSIF